MQDLLKVTNLVKAYSALSGRKVKQSNGSTVRIVVNNLSLTLNEGQALGMIGLEGEEKTTALRAIAGLTKINSGAVKVDGTDVRKNPKAVHSKMAFIVGDLKTDKAYTPSYLFDYFARLRGIAPEVAARRKEKLFTRLGIKQYAEIKLGKLTIGVQKRVAIAIGLVHDPDIILLDDPTNGMDILTVKIITDFLLSLKAEGKALLIASQSASVIEKACDHVVILVDGMQSYSGSLAEVHAASTLEEKFCEIYNANKGDGKYV